MEGASDNPRRTIAIFLVLTLVLSAITWVPQFRAGAIHPLWIVATMWAPGVAAIVTSLIVRRNLHGFGWKPERPKLLLAAYALPILYALPVYASAWASGLGTFDEGKWIADPRVGPWVGLLLIATAGLAGSLFSALGEEVGWRGLLVPELLKITSFRNAALISGAIWAAWHLPLILFADYRGQGTPLFYSIACFVAMVVGLGVITAWLTVRSGSFWPAAILHASHNLFVQAVFDSATIEGETTPYLTGEFGAGLAVTVWIVALLLVRFYPADRSAADAKRADR